MIKKNLKNFKGLDRNSNLHDKLEDICMCIDSERTIDEKCIWIYNNYILPLEKRRKLNRYRKLK